MALNFGKLSEESLVDKEVNPREIFSLLPEKHPKYKYPRDVQSEVWSRWFERRNQRDIVVKMNTGGGKTVVGLIILKSCLNDGTGPAVYLAPDKYLAQQVENEAKDLGLAVATDPNASEFLEGRAILITNIYTLINGKSKFGTSETGLKIPIGAVVVDDAHACLATTESQFTLTIDSSEELYEELFTLFRDDLLLQNESAVFEIEASSPDQLALVPFWAWDAKQDRVAKLLTEHRGDQSVMWTWPLIRDHLALCRCVFSAGRLEIAPRCLPIDAIPSFVSSKRRIFMTATLVDDSILVSDFNANPDYVVDHVTPKVANDIGDRMILAPQEIDPDLNEEDIKRFLRDQANAYNTVVIVPSRYRADFWEDVADRIATADNLAEVVGNLKKGHVGLVVLVNKYDGVDLPDDACRILVLDGLPQARKLIERVETNMLAGSKHILGRQIQRIEQGMGRGIRGNADYCVVLLMGGSITRSLFLIGAATMFSPATRAQLDLSKKVAGQLAKGFESLNEAMQACLKQDKEWKRVVRQAVANVAYPEKGTVRPIAMAQREAFDAAGIRDYARAEEAIQRVINETDKNANTNDESGWLRWQLAEYAQLRNAAEAQVILKAAIQRNRRLTKPLEGIDYERLSSTKLEQAKNATWRLLPFQENPNNLIVNANALLDDLKFAPDNASEFEAAMQELAAFLGFLSQRPEQDFKKGPDVLWAVGELKYFVIECKSGAAVEKISKHYANQLAGSVNWFNERYGNDCKCIPLLVHPSDVFENAATPPPGARIITTEKLNELKSAFRSYIHAARSSLINLDVAKVKKLLDHHRLTPDELIATFTCKAKGS
jgi:hypothetical protein